MTEAEVYLQKKRTAFFGGFDITSNLIIKFGLSYVLFYTLGLIGYYLVNIEFSETLNKYVTSYFSCTFSDDLSMNDNVKMIVYSSYSDLRTLFLIFIAGFTMFSSIAIYALLFYHALSLGFSSLYLVNSMSSSLIPEVNFFGLIFFLFSNAAVAAILIVFSSKTRIFTDEFKALGGRCKRIIRFKPLYIHIFTLLCMSGSILLINIIRYLLNIF